MCVCMCVVFFVIAFKEVLLVDIAHVLLHIHTHVNVHMYSDFNLPQFSQCKKTKQNKKKQNFYCLAYCCYTHKAYK